MVVLPRKHINGASVTVAMVTVVSRLMMELFGLMSAVNMVMRLSVVLCKLAGSSVVTVLLVVVTNISC